MLCFHQEGKRRLRPHLETIPHFSEDVWMFCCILQVWIRSSTSRHDHCKYKSIQIQSDDICHIVKQLCPDDGSMFSKVYFPLCRLCFRNIWTGTHLSCSCILWGEKQNRYQDNLIHLCSFYYVIEMNR